MIVRYHKTIPTALLPIVRERFEPFLPFFPGWCNELTIMHESANPNNLELQCSSEVPYRSVVITIYDPFFDNTVNWQYSLWHELVHAVTAPYARQSWIILDTFVEEGETKDLLRIQLRDAEEALASDLGILLDKITPVLS
jgi:hypothetical protein